MSLGRSLKVTRILTAALALLTLCAATRAQQGRGAGDVSSSPFNVAEEGGWAYCPGGETDGHRWFKTGGITRAALAKFDWPDDEEVEP